MSHQEYLGAQRRRRKEQSEAEAAGALVGVKMVF